MKETIVFEIQNVNQYKRDLILKELIKLKNSNYFEDVRYVEKISFPFRDNFSIFIRCEIMNDTYVLTLYGTDSLSTTYNMYKSFKINPLYINEVSTIPFLLMSF